VTRRPTTVSSTTMSSSTTTSHPCSTLTCRHGARCVLEDGTAQCRCPPPSDCTTPPQHQSRPGPVCGSDHNDYSSECEMLAASCTQQRHIHKLYDGYCGTYSSQCFVLISTIFLSITYVNCLQLLNSSLAMPMLVYVLLANH